VRKPRLTVGAGRWPARPSEWERVWAARPRLRGWLHAGALPVALGATTALALRRRRHRNAVAVYGAGLCAMLATSAGYHRLTRTEAQYRWSRPADHVMIFAAIAGTATPVAAGVLPPRAVRPAVTALWVAAAAGAFARVVDLRRGTFVGHVASVGLGWSGLALLPLVVRHHGVRVGALLAAGGVSYTVGAAFFAARRPNPWPEVFGYHEVWHTATLVGAAFHLAAIAEITRDGDESAGTSAEPAGGAARVRGPGTATPVIAADAVEDSPSA
jgi:hemolysin III